MRASTCKNLCQSHGSIHLGFKGCVDACLRDLRQRRREVRSTNYDILDSLSRCCCESPDRRDAKSFHVELMRLQAVRPSSHMSRQSPFDEKYSGHIAAARMILRTATARVGLSLARNGFVCEIPQATYIPQANPCLIELALREASVRLVID